MLPCFSAVDDVCLDLPCQTYYRSTTTPTAPFFNLTDWSCLNHKNSFMPRNSSVARTDSNITSIAATYHTHQLMCTDEVVFSLHSNRSPCRTTDARRYSNITPASATFHNTQPGRMWCPCTPIDPIAQCDDDTPHPSTTVAPSFATPQSFSLPTPAACPNCALPLP